MYTQHLQILILALLYTEHDFSGNTSSPVHRRSIDHYAPVSLRARTFMISTDDRIYRNSRTSHALARSRTYTLHCCCRRLLCDIARHGRHDANATRTVPPVRESLHQLPTRKHHRRLSSAMRCDGEPRGTHHGTREKERERDRKRWTVRKGDGCIERDGEVSLRALKSV